MHHLVYFFCFRHFHICTILFRYYVVVILALRVPSNSVSLLHGLAPCLHTSFPICLLKSSCNSYPTSTCLMTNTLRMLESRVFLHYLIKLYNINYNNLFKYKNGANCYQHHFIIIILSYFYFCFFINCVIFFFNNFCNIISKVRTNWVNNVFIFFVTHFS